MNARQPRQPGDPPPSLVTQGKLAGIQVVCFDADDTLWINETFFREAEACFCDLVAPYVPAEQAMRRLLEIERHNMPHYGYGIKPFTLSLIEAAVSVSDGAVSLSVIEQLIEGGKQMLEKPVELLSGVEETLAILAQQYRLVMATKGDLLDQERKLAKSGLEPYFHHIEIVSDKTPTHYRKLVGHLEIEPGQFLMVGNSLKSDVLPVLEIGAYGFHVPFHTTWVHEQVEGDVHHPRFAAFASVKDILELL